MAAAVDENVGRLDVEVQHAVFVGKGERLHQRVGDAGGLIVGERVAVDLREELLEAHAVNVLHDQVGIGAVVGEVDDLHDVGVLQHARRARLRKRGRSGLGGRAVVRRGERHALDGHAALEAPVEADLYAAKSAGGAGFERAVALEERGRRGAGWGWRRDVRVAQTGAGCWDIVERAGLARGA